MEGSVYKQVSKRYIHNETDVRNDTLGQYIGIFGKVQPEPVIIACCIYSAAPEFNSLSYNPGALI